MLCFESIFTLCFFNSANLTTTSIYIQPHSLFVEHNFVSPKSYTSIVADGQDANIPSNDVFHEKICHGSACICVSWKNLGHTVLLFSVRYKVHSVQTMQYFIFLDPFIFVAFSLGDNSCQKFWLFKVYLNVWSCISRPAGEQYYLDRS